MTPHGKANHVVHCSCTPTYWGAARRRTPVERVTYGNLMAFVNTIYVYKCTFDAALRHVLYRDNSASPHPITGVEITASSISNIAAAPTRYTKAKSSFI